MDLHLYQQNEVVQLRATAIEYGIETFFDD